MHVDVMKLLQAGEMRRMAILAKTPTDPREKLIAECRIAAIDEVAAMFTASNPEFALSLSVQLTAT
jgi:hypothetical protein